MKFVGTYIRSSVYHVVMFDVRIFFFDTTEIAPASGKWTICCEQLPTAIY